MALVDGQGGEDGEDEPVEDIVEVGAVVLVQGVPVRHDHAGRLQRGRHLLREDLALQLDQLVGSPGDGQELLAGLRPSGDRVRSPAATWSSRPATVTWKNSSSPSEKMARNFTRSRRGMRSSRCQLEQAGAELEPGQFTIDEAVVAEKRRRPVREVGFGLIRG